MTQASNPALTTASLSDVSTTLRRRWPWLLVLTVLGAVAGVLLQGQLPEPGPTAVTAVEIQPTGIDLSGSSARHEDALDADRAVARAQALDVHAQAVVDGGLDVTPEELQDATTVEQQADAPVLTITVELDDARAAVDAAAAIADAYLAMEAAEATARRDRRLAELRSERDEVLSEIGALGSRIGATEDLSEVGALEGQQAAALRRIVEIEGAIVDVSDQNVDPGRVLQPARLQEPGVEIGRAVALPALTALGLLLGLTAAMVAERVDRRVWAPEDVTAATGSTAVVHVTRRDLSGDGLRTGAGHRRLRALVAPRQQAVGAVLVTGASPDHGAGVAAGLAVAIAATGRHTVLLDAADADAFDLPAGDLEGWLAGRVGLDRAARSPEGVTSLRTLRGRPDGELAGSATLRELLAAPPAVVVVHVPGGSESGDAIALAELVDHVVVVGAARHDHAEVVARTHRWLGRDAASEPVLVLAG